MKAKENKIKVTGDSTLLEILEQDCRYKGVKSNFFKEENYAILDDSIIARRSIMRVNEDHAVLTRLEYKIV